jgi:hypothetical protein
MDDTLIACVCEGITDKGHAVPVTLDGEAVYYGSTLALPYRWYDGTVFQVLLEGLWYDAYSPDWYFNDCHKEVK